MRQHLRFLLLCSLAAVAAGCGNSDKDNNGGSNNALSPAAELCGSIGDKVWLDENGNGIQDGTEPGVPGVTVEAEVCGGSLAATTTTDANGNYLFDNLDDSVSYRLCFFAPPGYAWTVPNQGGVEQTDSDVMADGCLNACVILSDCKAPRYVDAGLVRTGEEGCGSIGDRVWLDGNCDGIQDGGEGGVSGVTVNLETCAGAFVGSTVTDGNGNYLFDNLDDSVDYRVCFVLPAGYSFAPANQGGVEGNDSDAGPDGCTVDCIDLNDCKAPRYVDAGLCREEDEAEGCTPGFWKNHLNHWAGTGYSPDDEFDAVFGCDLFGDDTTLGEALNSQGTLKNLGYHGVAALLNAASGGVDYKYSVSEVMDIVCDAVASGDLEGGKNLLADANEAGCPLSGK